MSCFAPTPSPAQPSPAQPSSPLSGELGTRGSVLILILSPLLWSCQRTSRNITVARKSTYMHQRSNQQMALRIFLNQIVHCFYKHSNFKTFIVKALAGKKKEGVVEFREDLVTALPCCHATPVRGFEPRPRERRAESCCQSHYLTEALFNCLLTRA